jgi:hypothetical protein
MDHVSFDRLTMRLATASTRRTGLGLLLGVAGGALADLFLSDDPGTEAKGKKGKKGKKSKGKGKKGGKGKGKKKKNKRPQPPPKQPPDQPCPGNMTDCGEGVCVPEGSCCPWEKPCGEGCLNAESCCPHTERECPGGACVAKDACCPLVEETCGDECCGLSELCTEDGCCSLAENNDVCGGKCTPLDSNENCGKCGNACGHCQTCKQINGEFTCAGPDRSAPACEDCLEGEVVSAVTCESFCCGLGAECCGGGCCAAGKCRESETGETCCLRVVDNRLVCQVQ